MYICDYAWQMVRQDLLPSQLHKMSENFACVNN